MSNQEGAAVVGMTKEEAVAALDTLGPKPDVWEDAEDWHSRADGILIEYLRQTRDGLMVAEAWESARERLQFWYA